jgi:hypothetical protein
MRNNKINCACANQNECTPVPARDGLGHKVKVKLSLFTAGRHMGIASTALLIPKFGG